MMPRVHFASVRGFTVLICAAGLLGPALALAQQPPAASASTVVEEPRLPVRFDLDLHGGLTYRIGGVDGSVVRGGGLLGLSALVGPRYSSWSGGLGYERFFLGEEKIDAGDDFTNIGRGLDALWLLGRGYVYQNQHSSYYVTLGLGPVWQRVSASGAVLVDDGTGVQQSRSVSCSAGDTPGLGLRAGGGAVLAINEYLGFHASLGLDHQRLSDDVIDRCAPGMGGATFLGLRLGFIITAGRVKREDTKPLPPSDQDGDGIVDLADACPAVPGIANADPTKHGCPPPGDMDGDKITDDLDACPIMAGVPDPDPKKHGCPPPPPPPDRDGDKVVDPQDACVDIPGVATNDPATNGCPPDTDGDGFRDDQDACPNEKGVANEDPKKQGCPLVVVTDKEIVITQQVQFETDRAIIRSVSDGLLDEVASVIKQHPELSKIEIQGHTDNTGTKFRNKQLSKDRADAVRKALVNRGVDAKLLDAKGYGDAEPIADNSTEEGKAKNRRVQFKILEKK